MASTTAPRTVRGEPPAAAGGRAPRRDVSPARNLWKYATVICLAVMLGFGANWMLTNFGSSHVQFQITDALSGNPVASVVASLYSSSQLAGRCYTDASGLCQVSVPQGTYTAAVASSDHDSRNVTVQAIGGFNVVALTVSPSFSTVIQPGSQAIGTRYVIFTDGSNTFAHNGLTGSIDYSGSSASVIQSVLSLTNVYGTTGGQIVFAKGNYSLGSTNISLSNGLTTLNLVWEPGASWYYTGSGYALSFIAPAQRGNFSRWNMINPQIYTSTGSCILLQTAYIFSIQNPMLYCKSIGINITNANTGYIQGGFIAKTGTARAAGSAGIVLGSTATTNAIQIQVPEIEFWANGIQMGASGTAVANYQLSIHGSGFEFNAVGIQVFSGQGLDIYANYFESQTTASIQATDTVPHNKIGDLLITGNTFLDSLCLNIPSNSYVYRITMNGNKLIGCSIVLGIVLGGTVDVTGASSVTNYGTRVALTITPNPVAGKVTGISTVSIGNVTGTVTYDSAFPTGVHYEVFVTLSSPTNATVVATAWVWSVKNTGFGWTVNVSAASAASSITLNWMAIMGSMS